MSKGANWATQGGPHHGQIGEDLLELQGAVAGRRKLRRQRCCVAIRPPAVRRRRGRVAG